MFDIREMARRLGVSTRTVFKELKDGRLGCVRVRGQLRFREEDFLEYINSNSK